MDRIEHLKGPDETERPLESELEVDWLVAEAHRQTFKVELLRLKRRAKKKPLVLVLVSFALVAAVLLKMSRKVPVYQASVVMRATESKLIEEESPFAGEGLANYLYTIALSRDRLLPLIEKYNLFPEREHLGDLYAVDELRDSLDIEISSNSFVRVRDDGDPLRTVGIAIHFSSRDHELAFEIARDLSQIMVEAEQERRAESAVKLEKIANVSVTKVEAKMAEVSAAIASSLLTIDSAKNLPGDQTKIAAAQIRVRRLKQDMSMLEQRLTQMVTSQEELALVVAIEEADLGMQFEVVDVERPEYIPPKSAVFFVIIGLFLFVCVIPLAAIGVSAMDSKLHHIDDLLRLNLPVVGHMPGFPGDSKGSLQERTRRAKETG